MSNDSIIEINCSNQSMSEVKDSSFLDGSVAYIAIKCPGLERDNQDSLGAFSQDKNIGICLLADGIGGHRAGDQASKIAISSIIEQFKKSKSNSSREKVFEGLEHANKNIRNLGVGAGTTIIVALIENKVATFFSIGDSH